MRHPADRRVLVLTITSLRAEALEHATTLDRLTGGRRKLTREIVVVRRQLDACREALEMLRTLLREGDR